MTSRERMLMKKKKRRRRAREKRKGCGGGEEIRERRGGHRGAAKREGQQLQIIARDREGMNSMKIFAYSGLELLKIHLSRRCRAGFRALLLSWSLRD